MSATRAQFLPDIYSIIRRYIERTARLELAVTSGARPLFTAIPRDPIDGQEIYLEEPTQRVVWHLRYSNAANVWRFVGGGQYEAQGAGGTPGGSYNSWQALGPGQFFVPFSGVYEVEVKCLYIQNIVPGANDMRVGLGNTGGGVYGELGIHIATAQWGGNSVRGSFPFDLPAGITIQTVSASLSNLAYSLAGPMVIVKPRYLYAT